MIRRGGYVTVFLFDENVKMFIFSFCWPRATNNLSSRRKILLLIFQTFKRVITIFLSVRRLRIILKQTFWKQLMSSLDIFTVHFYTFALYSWHVHIIPCRPTCYMLDRRKAVRRLQCFYNVLSLQNTQRARRGRPPASCYQVSPQ